MSFSQLPAVEKDTYFVSALMKQWNQKFMNGPLKVSISFQKSTAKFIFKYLPMHMAMQTSADKSFAAFTIRVYVSNCALE